MIWDGSNAANAWAVANGVTASTATWDWNPQSGVLTSVGRFESTIHLNSDPNARAVIDDKVVDLVIDTVNHATTATSYNCVEGNHLAIVDASGCANLILGDDFVNDSTLVYNVGGNSKCVTLTIGGDDFSYLDGFSGNPGTPAPRGLTAQTAGQAGSGCSQTSGGTVGNSPAFDLFTIVLDNTTTGGELILSNGTCLGVGPLDSNCAGVNYLTFSAVPIPPGVWLFGSGLGVMGWLRRNAA